MSITNTIVAKLTVAFVAVAMVFSFSASANAQTAEELQQMINDLLAQVASLQAQLGGDSASAASVCPYTWTRSLSQGDSGMDVMKLQEFLNADPATRVAAEGVGSAGMETEYYGALTGAAVAKFQEMYRSDILSPLGLVNATTYFGPSTMAKANALCVSAPADDADDADDSADDAADDADDTELGSGEGSIESLDEVSADESSLEEGQEGGVLAFELEIEGDVEVNRVDFFAEVDDDTTASDDADDYFVRAFLMVDGEEVAEVDVDDFDDDDYSGYVTNGAGADTEYRLRFSGLGLVFADGDSPEFQVGFEVLGSLDSADLAGNWYVAADSIRYVDGEGFTDTFDASAAEADFDFDAEAVADVVVSSSNDNPDGTTLEVETDDQSDEYEVFTFEIEEKEGVDVTVEDIRVTATTTNTSGDASAVIDEAILYYEGDAIASESVPANGVIDFENLGLDIDGDEAIDLTVALVFNGTDDYAEGDTVRVSFTSITDMSDENGNDEGDISPTGTPNGEWFTLRSAGLVLAAEVTDGNGSGDSEQVVGAAVDDNYGTMFLTFDITVLGDDDLWVKADDEFRGAASTTKGLSYQILDDGTATTAGSVSIDYDIDGADEDNGYFELESGKTYEMTVSVDYNPVAEGTYSLILNSVGYNDTEDTMADSTATPDDTTEYTSDETLIQS